MRWGGVVKRCSSEGGSGGTCGVEPNVRRWGAGREPYYMAVACRIDPGDRLSTRCEGLGWSRYLMGEEKVVGDPGIEPGRQCHKLIHIYYSVAYDFTLRPLELNCIEFLQFCIDFENLVERILITIASARCKWRYGSGMPNRVCGAISPMRALVDSVVG